MSDEKPKVAETALAVGDKVTMGGVPLGEVTAIEASKQRQERRELRIRKRQSRLADALLNAQSVAVEHHELKKHMFKPDEVLRKLGLTDEQIALVRGWESPKKGAPFGLESSSTIVTSLLRRQNETGKVTVNVENMNIVQLPEKQAETMKPVVIEVVPEVK